MAKKKHISAYDLAAARMKAHEGCESKSVETRQSRRAASRKEALAGITYQYGQELRAVRRGLVLIPSRPKNRLKGPRWMHVAKQVTAKRAAV